MSWADAAISALGRGEKAVIHPRGHSMTPRISSGQRVLLSPIADPASLVRGEIVLVRVKGAVYLHLISAADRNRVQISNNRGRVNGWVPRSSVYGRAVEIGDPS